MSNNAALARRWFAEVWNDRRDATVDELMHSEAVGHMEWIVWDPSSDQFG